MADQDQILIGQLLGSLRSVKDALARMDANQDKANKRLEKLETRAARLEENAKTASSMGESHHELLQGRDGLLSELRVLQEQLDSERTARIAADDQIESVITDCFNTVRATVQTNERTINSLVSTDLVHIESKQASLDKKWLKAGAASSGLAYALYELLRAITNALN
jgi:chromosome segregation ATPase